MTVHAEDYMIERVDELISEMEDREDAFYVALELAYQLRDELKQALDD